MNDLKESVDAPNAPALQTADENMESVNKWIEVFQEKIGSKTGCAAKWFQSTLHLQNGLTQSCYNTPEHQIDPDMLKITPAALHNTTEKARQRYEMKKEMKPSGCEYCWRIEAQNSEILSDRARWNAYLGKDVNPDEIKNKPANYMFTPRVLEVSFSNMCNFMCGYCHPKNSSRFYNEIKTLGHYKDVQSHNCDIHFLKIYPEDANPYLEAFWLWWPQLSLELKTMRLTGGEPLIQKSTLKLIELLKTDPRPQLDLSINTNLGLPHNKFVEICEKLKALVETNSVKKLHLYTSMDTWGDHAEYIRYGLDLKVFQQNVEYYLENFPNQQLSYMVTFNIFSLARFTELMGFWLSLKKRFNTNVNRVKVYINLLTEPIVYSYLLLPENFALEQFDKILEFARQNYEETNVKGFNDFVINDIKKARNDYILNKLPANKLAEGRADFVRFFRQYDQRKNLNLMKTFPEYAEIFKSWEFIEETKNTEIDREGGI